MSALTHRRPSKENLVTSILLLAIIIHLNYAGAQTFPNTVVINLSRFDLLTKRVVTVNLGDTVVLQCAEDFYAEIVQQTEAQLNLCDNRVNNINNEEPVRISACLGEASQTSIPIETASEMLQSSRVFEPGNSYYYTSYSLDNLVRLSVGLYGRTDGGLCSAGFKLELKVNEEPTSPPTSIVESQATTDASTGNVYNGNSEITIGGPGLVEATATSPNVDGLNSASPIGSSSLLFITIVSAVLCALLLSKFLY